MHIVATYYAKVNIKILVVANRLYPLHWTWTACIIWCPTANIFWKFDQLLVFKCSTAWPLCHLAVIVSFIVPKVMIVRTECAVEVKLCSYPVPVQVHNVPFLPQLAPLALLYDAQLHCSKWQWRSRDCMYSSAPSFVQWAAALLTAATRLLCHNCVESSDPAFVTQFWSNVLSIHLPVQSATHCSFIVRESTDCGVLDCEPLDCKFYIQAPPVTVNARRALLDGSATHNELAGNAIGTDPAK